MLALLTSIVVSACVSAYGLGKGSLSLSGLSPRDVLAQLLRPSVYLS